MNNNQENINKSSQLILNFDSKVNAIDDKIEKGKIIHIDSFVKKQKSELIRQIVRNTKSF